MIVNKVLVSGLEESIKASKYPMSTNIELLNSDVTKTVESLGKSKIGSGHDQFLTGITVSFDLTCTIKMWVEMERYTFVNFVSSQSTMHKITNMDVKNQCNRYVLNSTIDELFKLIDSYNKISDKNKTENYAKELYLQILYNVPTGFELTARLVTNYRALKTVYYQRRNHRLPEWREFCRWIETLPYAQELILEKGE